MNLETTQRTEPIPGFRLRPLVKLPGPHIINLDRVNEIEFQPDPPVAKLTWTTGDSPMILRGSKAIALMDAIELLCPLDVSYVMEVEDDHA